MSLIVHQTTHASQIDTAENTFSYSTDHWGIPKAPNLSSAPSSSSSTGGDPKVSAKFCNFLDLADQRLVKALAAPFGKNYKCSRVNRNTKNLARFERRSSTDNNRISIFCECLRSPQDTPSLK